MMGLRVGKKLKLPPFHLVDELGRTMKSVTLMPCTIIYINTKHRFFTVEFVFRNGTIRESYNYSFRRKPGADDDEMLIW